MTLNDAAEKITANPVLGAIARLAMFLTPIIVTIGLFVVGQWLDANTRAYVALAARVTAVEQDSAMHNTRLSVLETNVTSGAVQRAQITQQLNEMLKSVQQLAIDAASTRTDVGYLRRWVEAQKREAAGNSD